MALIWGEVAVASIARTVMEPFVGRPMLRGEDFTVNHFETQSQVVLFLGSRNAPAVPVILPCNCPQRRIVSPVLPAAKQAQEARHRQPESPGWNEADVVARMQAILSGLNEKDIRQSILVVDRDRARRRRLPLKK